MSNKLLLVYLGHHRCGSNWIMKVIEDVCDLIGRRTSPGAHNPRLFDHDLQSYVRANDIDFLCYTNADYHYVRLLTNFRGFHVVRDPRDILISSYFSHLYSHPTKGWPELVEHRNKLQVVTKEEGIKLEMAFREWQFKHLSNWTYYSPNVLEVKMEDLSQNPQQEFLKIFSFLGLMSETNTTSNFDFLRVWVNNLHRRSRGMIPFLSARDRLSPTQLSEIVEKNSFSRLADGRGPGQEDVKSHYRKGKAGDWRNHFTEEHVQLFKEKYNDLLVKMGYENNYNWELEPLPF